MDGVLSLIVNAHADKPDLLSIECQVEMRDGIEAAIARAVAGRWSLHRLERKQPTLENIFLRYISENPDSGDKAPA